MRKVIRPTPEVPATPPPSGLLLGTCDCEGVGDGVGGLDFSMENCYRIAQALFVTLYPDSSK